MSNIKRRILLSIIKKRFQKKLKRLRKKKQAKYKSHKKYIKSLNSKKKQRKKSIPYEVFLKENATPNLSFLLFNSKSDFNLKSLKKAVLPAEKVFLIPQVFSIIDNPKSSYLVVKNIVAALLTQKCKKVIVDYSFCRKVGLETQVFFDIIFNEILSFINLSKNYPLKTRSNVENIEWRGFHKDNEDVGKLLFSVGSPAIHGNRVEFEDVIPYSLCIHDRERGGNPLKTSEQKEVDTTKLVDYVIACLARLNKKLTPEKLDNLCTVIGETLINAEEHSTTNHRFSIGYFNEVSIEKTHYGLFRLTILNFGDTIYEKFKDPSCPNSAIVRKMEDISKRYTAKNWFLAREFEEETLWTLYSLQEGVTSVAPDKYKKRGNGSMQFIDSFFNIKGIKKDSDNVSRLTILSGNTNIIFDGTYNIVEKAVSGDIFKFMTFNDTGNIEDKPDARFVKFIDNYFPGTIISAEILFNEDDIDA